MPFDLRRFIEFGSFFEVYLLILEQLLQVFYAFVGLALGVLSGSGLSPEISSFDQAGLTSTWGQCNALPLL